MRNSRRLAWACLLGSPLVLGGCVGGVGVAEGGYDMGGDYYEPYGYNYGGFDGGYELGPYRDGFGRGGFDHGRGFNHGGDIGHGGLGHGGGFPGIPGGRGGGGGFGGGHGGGGGHGR